MKPRPDNTLLPALAHVACCGLPLLIVVIVAGALPVTAGVAIVAGIGALAVAALLWLRRCRACKPAGQEPPARREPVPTRAGDRSHAPRLAPYGSRHRPPAKTRD